MAFRFWPSHTHLCCSNAAHSSPVKFKTQVNRLFYDRSFQTETTEAPSAYFQTSTPTPLHLLPLEILGLWGIVGKITILNIEGRKKQRKSCWDLYFFSFPFSFFHFFFKENFGWFLLGWDICWSLIPSVWVSHWLPYFSSKSSIQSSKLGWCVSPSQNPLAKRKDTNSAKELLQNATNT